MIKGKGQWVGWPGLHLPSDYDDATLPESDPSDQTPTAGLKSKQVLIKNHFRIYVSIHSVFFSFDNLRWLQ